MRRMFALCVTILAVSCAAHDAFAGGEKLSKEPKPSATVHFLKSKKAYAMFDVGGKKIFPPDGGRWGPGNGSLDPSIALGWQAKDWLRVGVALHFDGDDNVQIMTGLYGSFK